MANINDSAWWADLGERLVNNEVQALAPLFAALATAGAGFNWTSVALAALYVAVWTFIKNVAGLQAREDASTWLKYTDRIGSAVAASVLTTLPYDFWGYDHWDRVGYAALGAAVSALVMNFVRRDPSGDGGDAPAAGGNLDGLAGHPA
jgi:hypothetical protein